MTKKSLRRGDACETTLNPGFKWERVAAFGLPARGGLALPATSTPPVSLLRDKANVAHAVAHGRGRDQYRHEDVAGKHHRSPADARIQVSRRPALLREQRVESCIGGVDQLEQLVVLLALADERMFQAKRIRQRSTSPEMASEVAR